MSVKDRVFAQGIHSAAFLLGLGNNPGEMTSAHFYGSLQVSATLAGWIKRPPLLGVSPPT